MLNAKEARDLSKMMKARDIFPEAREHISRTLFDYYKELLMTNRRPPVPTVRRMW